MSAFFILLICLLYIGLLFYIGYRAEKDSLKNRSLSRKAVVYSLSIGVYCTTWTFYGAVGSAANTGINYFAIYLGPILLFVFGMPVLRRIANLCLEQKTTSLSDFIAARYGKSRLIAVMISLLATFAIIPYLALQLKAITMSFDLLTVNSFDQLSNVGETLFLTLLLIIFTIVFGARKLDVTEHHPGLMNAIAFESIVKVMAFVFIGVFCCYWLINYSSTDSLITSMKVTTVFSGELNADFFVQTLLAVCAMLCLPRQFHVTFVEYDNPKDIGFARKIVPIYLLLFALFVLPIVAVGGEMFAGQHMAADTYIIGIPLEINNSWLALFVFLGGLSAGTGMVIVASTTLSTMLSNDIFIPVYAYRNRHKQSSGRLLQRAILRIRRVLIAVILGLAFLFYLWIDAIQSLANIGLLAFSLVAHFAPALLFGIYWTKANKAAVITGIGTGIFVWLLYFLNSQSLETKIMLDYQADGLFGYSVLVESTLLSLIAHILAFIGVSTAFPANLNEKIQAHLFVHPKDKSGKFNQNIPDEMTTINRLFTLMENIVGEKRARESFTHWVEDESIDLNSSLPADSYLIQNTELMLSGVIGAPSARALIHGLTNSNRQATNDLASIIGSTAEAVRFNRALTEQVLDNITQGISVIDFEKRIVAWNDSYLELLQYPEGFIYSGKPLDEIIRFNAQRGYCGPGGIEEHVSKRLAYLDQGVAYRFERFRDDGIILDIRGNPLPGGRYVTTYTDITEYKKIQHALEEANTGLEQRVHQRTAELLTAKAEAEAATKSKTRFLAAASHDLLQPFNAAKLLTAVLEADDSLPVDQHGLIKKLSASLAAAEDILSVLIEISKLDRNKLDAHFTEFALHEIFSSLEDQFIGFAERKSLKLKVRKNQFVVRSDRKLLHRLLQNLLSNAIRYTKSGGVLVSAQKRILNNQSMVLISVWDTGVGIAEEFQDEVFAEFKRINNDITFDEETALGLGLAISKRIAHLLGTEIELRSVPDKGSVFSVLIPLSSTSVTKSHTESLILTSRDKDSDELKRNIEKLTVLTVDNELKITDAMHTLLSQWCKRVYQANSLTEVEQLLKDGLRPDIIFADYHLDNGETGLQVMRLFEKTACEKVIVTADHSSSLEEFISESGYQLLHKPVGAEDLYSIIRHQAGKLT